MRSGIILPLLGLAWMLLPAPAGAGAGRLPPIQIRVPDEVPATEPAPAGEDYDDLFDQGLLLFKYHEFKAARALLERAHALAPGDPELLLVLGIACFRTGDAARAEPLLRQVASSAADG